MILDFFHITKFIEKLFLSAKCSQIERDALSVSESCNTILFFFDPLLI